MSRFGLKETLALRKFVNDLLDNEDIMRAERAEMLKEQAVVRAEEFLQRAMKAEWMVSVMLAHIKGAIEQIDVAVKYAARVSCKDMRELFVYWEQRIRESGVTIEE